MLRGVYPEPLHGGQGCSQRGGERAQHDSGGNDEPSASGADPGDAEGPNVPPSLERWKAEEIMTLLTRRQVVHYTAAATQARLSATLYGLLIRRHGKPGFHGLRPNRYWTHPQRRREYLELMVDLYPELQEVLDREPTATDVDSGAPDFSPVPEASGTSPP